MSLEKEYTFFMDQSEKRLFKRLEIGVEVELLINGTPVKATTANISCGGLFLMMDPENVKQDQDLSFTIHLPNQKRPVEVGGHVLRQDPERNGVAVKFDGLYNDNILAIEKFIKSNLH